MSLEVAPRETYSARLERIRHGDRAAVLSAPGKRAELFNAQLDSALKKYPDGIPEHQARELVALYLRLFGE